MFKQRLISAIFLIPSIITLLFVLSLLQFIIFTLLICILSAWEWGKLSNLSFYNQKNWLLFVFILLMCITTLHTHINQLLLFNFYKNNCHILMGIILIWWSIILILLSQYPKSATIWHKSNIAWLTCGILLIVPFFWGILTLRSYTYSMDFYSGSWLLLYLITLNWEIDSTAYVCGKILGYHKCVPKISPNKTWEGYIGSIVITIFTFWIITKYKYIPIDIESNKLFSYSIITILFSVLGDLTESMFKRESGVKNSGQLIPGHGGILDALDSLIASVPIFTCFILSNINF